MVVIDIFLSWYTFLFHRLFIEDHLWENRLYLQVYLLIYFDIDRNNISIIFFLILQ